MKKNLVAAFALALVSSLPGRAAEISWSNPSGGNWSVPGNWDLNRVPAADDTVRIELSGNYSVMLTAPITVAGLSVGGAEGAQMLQNGGHSMNITGSAAIGARGTLVFIAGTLSGGNVTVAGALTWSAGVMTGEARTTIAAGGTANLLGSSEKELDAGRVFENLGTVTWSDGNIDLNATGVGGSGRIENGPGGTFLIQSLNRSIFATGTVDLPAAPLPSFANAGIVRKRVGGQGATISVPFSNTGTVEVELGLLRLSGGGSNAGTFLAFADGSLAPETLSFETGSSLTGDGLYLFDAGTQTFNASQTIPRLTVSSGRIAGAANLTVAGAMTWTGGNMSETGRTIIAPGAALTISGTGEKEMDSGRILEIRGAVVWIDGNIDLNGTGTSGSGQIENFGSFEMQPNGRSIFATATADANTPPLARFSNAGVLTRTTGTGEVGMNVSFENSGTVDAQTGTLRFNNGGTSSAIFTVAPGATIAPETFVFAAGATMAGDGTYLFDTGSQVFQANVDIPNLTMTAGRAGGPGRVRITRSMLWQGGTWGDAGETVIEGTATATLSSAGEKGLDAGRVFQNLGTTIWADGHIDLNDSGIGGSGRIENLAGLFEIRANSRNMFATGTADLGQAPLPSFSNAAILRKTTGAGEVGINVTFNNSGRVEAQTGALRMTGGGRNTGEFNVSAGATITPQTMTFADGSVLSGAGTYLLDTGIQVFESNHTIPNVMMIGGRLSGEGTVTIGATMTWQGGVLGGPGTVAIAPGAVATLSGTGEKELDAGRILENRGSIQWLDGNIDLNATSNGGSGRIDNFPEGVFEIRGNNRSMFATATVDLANPPLPEFSNQGIVRRSAGAGEIAFTVPFVNLLTGQLIANTGSVRLGGGGSSRGAFVASGGVIAPGTYVFDVGSSMTGDTAYSFGSGTRTFRLDANHTIPRVDKTGGAEAGPGNISISQSLQWSGGVMSDGGKTTILPGATATLLGTGEKELDSGRVLENRGTILWQDGNIDLNSSSQGGSGRIDNTAEGLFDMQSANRAVFATTTVDVGLDPLPSFSNAGTVRKSAGAGESSFSVPFSNTGLIEIQAGVVGFNTVPNLLPAGRARFGIGRLVGQSPNGSIRVTGAAALNGGLEVALLDGFLPAENAEFQIVTASADLSGAFATTTGNALFGGLYLNPNYAPRAVKLIAQTTRPRVETRAGLGGQFRINGIVGLNYRIAATTTLRDDDWQTLQTTAIPPVGYLDFADMDAANFAFRFYKVTFVATP